MKNFISPERNDGDTLIAGYFQYDMKKGIIPDNLVVPVIQVDHEIHIFIPQIGLLFLKTGLISTQDRWGRHRVGYH